MFKTNQITQDQLALLYLKNDEEYIIDQKERGQTN